MTITTNSETADLLSQEKQFNSIPKKEIDLLYVVESDDAVSVLNKIDIEALSLSKFKNAAEILPAFQHLAGLNKSIVVLAGGQFYLSEFSEQICCALFAVSINLRVVNLTKAISGHVRTILDWYKMNKDQTPEVLKMQLATLAEKAQPWIQSTGWIEPIQSKLDNLGKSKFPVQSLPKWLGDAVTTLSDTFQIYPGLAGSLSLGILSLVFQGKWIVCPRKDWKEELSLFVAAALPSGTGKSIVFRQMLKPVNDFERKVRKENRANGTTQIVKREILYGKRKDAKRRAIKGEISAEEEVIAFDKELAEIDLKPSYELYTSNVTPESLTEQLAKHEEKFGVFSPEGGEFFSIMAGRYSKKGAPNIDEILKIDGSDEIRNHRKSQDGNATILDRPNLTVCLLLQPYIFKKTSYIREFKERGFLGRFLMCDLPNPLGNRDFANEVPMDLDVLENYGKHVLKLMESNYLVDSSLELKSIFFSSKAYDVLNMFRQEIENELGEFGNYRGISSFAGKLPGRIVRISGLLHIVETFPNNDPSSTQISADTVRKAISIGKYYLEHKLLIENNYISTPENQLENKILTQIKKKGFLTFKTRDIARFVHRTAAETKSILEHLTENNYIKNVKAKNGEKSKKWIVNPYLVKSCNVTVVKEVTRVTEGEGINNG